MRYRARRSRRRRRNLYVALRLIALVGLYAALGFWVAPWIIRTQVVAPPLQDQSVRMTLLLS